MRITIENKISETYMELYHFEYSGGVYDYVGITHSRRNGAGDIWGHKWSEHFAKEIAANEEKTQELWYEHGDNALAMREYLDLDHQYNPVCHKTESGEPYCGGCYFGLKAEEKYQPKMSEEEIKKAIVLEVNKKMLKKIKLDMRK